MPTTHSNRRMRTYTLAALVASVLGFGSYGVQRGSTRVRAASAHAAPSSPGAAFAEAPAPRKVHGHGYVVDLNFEEQNAFPGTTVAVRGVVTRVLPARYVRTGKLEYVYTPVVLDVSKVYRGKVQLGELTIRAFGGTAGGVTYEADFSPSDEILNVGVELFVLGADPLVVAGDEPMEAMTPNGIHVIHGHEIADVTHADREGLKAERVLPLAFAEAVLAR